MEIEKALRFAQERLDKISYNLEMTNGLPCRSFYEKQQEMLVCAVAALRAQAEREKGRKLCNSRVLDTVGATQQFGEPSIALFGGISRPRKDEHFKFCPMRGRKLVENDE